MTTPLTDKQIDHLIADYLAGSLREDHRLAFENWLRKSPANPRRVARLSVTDYAIREVCQDTKADYLLDVLNQIDDAAGPAQLVTLHHIDSGWHRYRLPFAIGGAIAAVLLIAVTLIIALPSNTSSEFVTTPTSPSEPGRHGPAQADQPVVATLTASHNAQWTGGPASAGLATGDTLHPGDRLTLTAGFAEITTNDGAIAILEAPATIELLDHNNALHLHVGKLTGFCDTDTSKGFAVFTPNARILDLGTAFGVEFDKDDQSTHVQVFRGEVQAERSDSSFQGLVPVDLKANQALLIGRGSLPRRVAFDAMRYEQAMAFAQSRQPRDLTKVTWLDLAPADLRTGAQESDALQVFAERHGYTLNAELRVDHDPHGHAGSAPLVAGERVASYFLHYDPIDVEGEPTTREFIIGFERPILGVLCYGESLSTSNALFGLPGTQYPSDLTSAGLEQGSADEVHIAADGRTLRLKLRAGKAYLDQLRVLIQAEETYE